MEIKSYLPKKYEIFHLHSHQEIRQGTDKVTLPPKINQIADDIVKQFSQNLLNIHIPFAPIAVYFNNNYTPNWYPHHIHRLVFQNIAKEFIKR